MIATILTVTAIAAPAPLLDAAVRCGCETHPDPEACATERGPEIREMARELHAVGAEAVERYGWPDWFASWPAAQTCRESLFNPNALGDRDESVGPLQTKKWLVSYWRRVTGEELDRTDAAATARALIRVIAWSYNERVERFCGPVPPDLRLRLAVARVTRSHWSERYPGRTRCDFWARYGEEFKPTAGITVEWARRWAGEAGR